jgi:hypothetical protein
MQYLLSKEEYESLIHAKELAEEKLAGANAKLEEVKQKFIRDLSALVGSYPKPIWDDSYLGHNYQLFVRGVRDALSEFKL